MNPSLNDLDEVFHVTRDPIPNHRAGNNPEYHISLKQTFTLDDKNNLSMKELHVGADAESLYSIIRKALVGSNNNVFQTEYIVYLNGNHFDIDLLNILRERLRENDAHCSLSIRSEIQAGANIPEETLVRLSNEMPRNLECINMRGNLPEDIFLRFINALPPNLERFELDCPALTIPIQDALVRQLVMPTCQIREMIFDRDPLGLGHVSNVVDSGSFLMALKNNNSLEKLEFHNTKFASNDILQFLKVLQYCPKLKSLTLSDSKPPELDFQSSTTVIPPCPNLHELGLGIDYDHVHVQEMPNVSRLHEQGIRSLNY